MALSGKICLVTGASRGIGKGIAVQLGEAGATVYITGRSSSEDAAVVGGTLKETESEISGRGGKGIAVVCDHSKDEEVKQLFEKIKQDHGQLDVLVNNAFAAVTAIFNETNAKRTFWQCEKEPGEFWNIVNDVGLRNHYICSVYAAQMMTEARQGLIVNISSMGGIKYLFNVAYGIGKAGVDRMTADMAHELKRYNVACVTLYPGAVLTEQVAAFSNASKNISKTFSKSETPEFSGKVVVGLVKDTNIMAKSGKIHLSADLAKEYGFTDVNGVQPVSYRQLNVVLTMTGHTWLAAIVPDFIRIPGIFMSPSKF